MLRRLGLCLFLAWATGVTAVAADEMTPTGTLRVAVAVGPVGSPFWAVKDEATGAPRGPTVDLGAALAHKLGVPLALVVYQNSGQITASAASGAWDLTFVPMDPERAKVLDFGPVYEIQEATYLVAPGSALHTLADVDQPGIRVAAVAGTTTGRAAQASLTRTKVEGYQTIEEIMALMRDGKVDAFALPRDSLRHLAASLPGSRVLPGTFFTTRTAVAVPKGHAAALATARAFMETAKLDGQLATILASHGFAPEKP
jgi:polar amino acid transport system substrate-binding protein